MFLALTSTYYAFETALEIRNAKSNTVFSYFKEMKASNAWNVKRRQAMLGMC